LFSFNKQNAEFVKLHLIVPFSVVALELVIGVLNEIASIVNNFPSKILKFEDICNCNILLQHEKQLGWK
jgi:hypothetical protein